MTDSIRFWRNRMKQFSPEASGLSAAPAEPVPPSPAQVGITQEPEQEPELPMAQDPIGALLSRSWKSPSTPATTTRI